MTLAQIENQKSKIENLTPRLHFVHIPTPGDHYSPATGSAVMTVIHGMTAPHVARGNPAAILVSRGTTVNYPPYAAGTTREIDLPTVLPTKMQKIWDVACGRLFLTRPHAARQYAPAADALGPDFAGTVFIHNAPAAIPLLRRRLPRAFLALYAHNQLFNTYRPREIRHILARADAILCVSNFIAHDIATRARENSPKIKTVLNGVDIDTFAPLNPNPSFSLPSQISNLKSQIPSPPIILFLGRVLPEKGPDLLLKAAAQVDLPFRIHIVGSSNFNARDPLTPYEEQLRILAEPLGDKVAFLPFVPRDRVVAEYRRATLFVAPSNWDEPFGLTIAEALACGIPSILAQRGGIPEVAADSALYFTPPDTTTLANHLRRLLTDHTLRADLAQKARARADFLSWPRRYQTLLEALNIAALSP